MDSGNTYSLSNGKDARTSNVVMSRREFCGAQLMGVVLFVVGLVGGILIGIYAYHGASDLEVVCKVS